MDEPSVRILEKVPYERRFTCLFPKLRSNEFSLAAADLDVLCGGDHVLQEWCTSNDVYRAPDINFEICLRERVVGKLPQFLCWCNVAELSIPLVHRSEALCDGARLMVYVLFLSLFVQTEPSISAFCSVLYISAGSNRERLNVIDKI